MRYAPPAAMRMQDRGGGLNPTSVRSYNERLVISLLREHDRLSRMELCQLSGLSAQTISVIVRALERDELILRGEAQRGKVGPPSIPMSLNPEGAYSVGIKIGRRNTDTVLVDFLGQVRGHVALDYGHAAPDRIIAHLHESVPAMMSALGPDRQDRVVGVGIALPDGIDTWASRGGAEPAPDGWSAADLERHIGDLVGSPVHLQNDVTAAAGAEATFGAARRLGDFAYFFLGATVESRLVLNHHVYAGRKGRPQPAQEARDGSGHPASLTTLAAALEAAGHPAGSIWAFRETWPDFGAPLDDWINSGASGLCEAVSALTAFVDVETVIIDGRIPPDVRDRFCAAVFRHGTATLPAGPEFRPGTIGGLAKAIGAANLAFHARFMIEGAALG